MDKKFNAFGGIRNTVSTERLEKSVRQKGGADQRTDLVTAVNVDLDDTGRPSRRAGQTIQVAGTAHSIWAKNDLCLFVQAGALKKLSSAYVATTIRTGMTAARVRYVEVNGRVYWTDGVQTGAVVGGAAQSWGVAVPLYQPQATVGAGNLAAGTYQYAMTYYRNDGQESGTGPAERIDLADGSGITFTWTPPTDPDITEAWFYLTTPNGEVLYLAMFALANAGTATFTGGALTLPLNTMWLDAPPAGQDLAYSRGRVYIAVGSFIFATAPFGYSYVDMRDYLAIDDSAIAFVAGVEHGLYVGTEKAVYFLKGDTLADMTMTMVVGGYGVAGSAVSADGFAATGDKSREGSEYVFFATSLGLCMGDPNGSVSNLTLDRFQSNIDRTGAAVFRTTDTLTQYLITTQE